MKISDGDRAAYHDEAEPMILEALRLSDMIQVVALILAHGFDAEKRERLSSILFEGLQTYADALARANSD